MIRTIIGFWYNEEKSNTNLVYCINFDYDLLLYKLLTIHHLLWLDTPSSILGIIWKKVLVNLHNFYLSNPLHIKVDEITYFMLEKVDDDVTHGNRSQPQNYDGGEKRNETAKERTFY